MEVPFGATVRAAIAVLVAVPTWAAPPLSLDDAVQQALATHPRIKAALARWQGADALARATTPPADPELELEIEGMSSALGIGNHVERSIGVTQRFALPMAWHHGRAAARASADAVLHGDLEVARLEVILEAATTYLDVQLAERLLALARSDHKRATHLSRLAQRRRDIAGAPALDALRAEVEANRAAVRVANRQDDVADMQARLNALLDRELDTPVGLMDSLAARHLDPDETRLRQRAFRRRPAVTAAVHRHEAARRQARATRASVLPAVDVGLFRHDLDALGAPSTWRLSVAVELPLWAAGRQRSTAEAAGADALRLGHELARTRRQVELEVNTTVRRYIGTHRTLSLLEEELLREASAVHAAARRSWEQGQASQVDVINAQRTLHEIQMEHARAIHEHEIARHTLIRAVGAPLDSDGADR